MEDKNMSNPPISAKNPNIFLIILSTVLITVLIVGVIVYFWPQLKRFDPQEKQIALLQAQINILKKNSKAYLPTTTTSPIVAIPTIKPLASLKPISTPLPPLSNTCTQLPVVAYSRAGLLNDTEGLIEKAKLEQKFINPYIDYQKEKSTNLISLHITVPQNIGEKYEVDAIFEKGVMQSFLFGKFKQDFDWWKPDCMGGCTFSEAYRTKYPQVIE